MYGALSDRRSNIAEFKMQQVLDLDLTPRSWGGSREGAGRKTNKSKGIPSHDSPHDSRPKHRARSPVHAVLRCLKDVANLRCPAVYECVQGALRKLAARADFRIIHLSIQRNHVHCLAEADDDAALESGMRAFSISLAKRINRALDRKGKVFEYRYHSTELTSPRQTRNALAYVLNNWRRHNEDERNGVAERFMILDRYSSAIRFTGWADWQLGRWPDNYAALAVASPQTWLLSKGWEKARRPIRTSDTPGRIG
jgi:REP element-mobilizing transposase RayT